MWLLYMLVGSLFVLWCDILYSKCEFNLKNTLIIIPICIISNIFYWIAFRMETSFIKVWLIGTGCISLLAILYSIMFNNQPITSKIAIGCILILTGSFLLNYK